MTVSVKLFSAFCSMALRLEVIILQPGQPVVVVPLHAGNFPLREFSMFTSPMLLLMGLCAAPPYSWLLNTIKGLQMLQLCTCAWVPACQRADCCSDVGGNPKASQKAIDTSELCKRSYSRWEWGKLWRSALFFPPLIFLSSHVFRDTTWWLWLHICAASSWIRRQ